MEVVLRAGWFGVYIRDNTLVGCLDHIVQKGNLFARIVRREFYAGFHFVFFCVGVTELQEVLQFCLSMDPYKEDVINVAKPAGRTESMLLLIII